MHEPYLAIYVQSGKLFFLKKLPKEKELREIFWVEIDEVISTEVDEASKKIGGTVLGILRLWHPDILNNWGNDSSNGNVEEYVPNDFDIAMHLISKSVSEKTNAHVQSIETLLREQSLRTKAGQEFFSESWPVIRTQLEKFN